jgi:hypothetical protein
MRMRLLRLSIALALLLAVPALATLVAGCQVEDRTPFGSRRDEDAVRGVVAGYYRSVSAQRWDSAGRALWDSAAVTVRPRSDSGWVDFHDAAHYLAYLADRDRGLRPGDLGPRMTRIDFRQEGGVAAVWVSLRLNEGGSPADRHEVGRVDHFVLRRFGMRWQIVNLVSVPEPAARAS